jgi:RecA-family ATPase
MPFETFQQLLAWNPPTPTQWIANDILSEEFKICIFGGPKMMKSILAQQTAMCLAADIPWLGYSVTKCRVLYLQGEITKFGFRLRVIKMARNLGAPIPPGSLYFDSTFTFKLDRKSDIDRLRKDIAKLKPKVLIIDPWYKMLSTEDNRAYDTTKDIMDTLIADFSISIIMVHHDTVPKTDMNGKIIKTFHPRGPRTIEGWFDTLIQIDGELDSDVRTLAFETRHGQSLIKPIMVELDRSLLWLKPLP